MTGLPIAPHQSSFAGFIGIAREDITPAPGIYCRTWGAAKHDYATGIHRPLTATILTLQRDADDTPCVLAALDLGWWRTAEDEWDVRGSLIEEFGLTQERVMVNLSHTHSAPVSCDYPNKRTVRDAIIDCTRRALATRRRAELDWSYGKCDLARDRDLADPERPRVVCGFNPNRRADDTLLVGRVSDQSGSVMATIINYACHPTTLGWNNELISPDYVGAMREVVECHTGGAPCLFLQGASGELGPRDGFNVGTDVADANGRKLGYAAASTLEGMLPAGAGLVYNGVVESGAPLATWKRESRQSSVTLRATVVQADLPIKSDLPTLEHIEAEMALCTDRTDRERLARKRRIRGSIGNETSMHRPIWVWRLGEAILIGQPEEAYSWLQTELRGKFPDRAIAVLNVTNFGIGYLPPASLYDQDIYQVWQTPFERGCLEIVEDTARRGIQEALAS